jgi:hypothetical protein
MTTQNSMVLLLLSGPLALSQQVYGQQPRAPRGTRAQYDWCPNRRWRGTVGRQSVTLALDSVGWGRLGQYSYDRFGRSLSLDQQRGTSGPSVAFNERDWDNPGIGNLVLLSGLPGPVLTGTWRSADKRRSAPVALRETYIDAIRYEEETWTLTRHLPGTDADSAQCQRSYLRVHLPQNPRVEQQLRRQLGPPVPGRRMWAYLDSTLADRPDRYYQEYRVSVECNTNYLLSVAWPHRETDTTQLDLHQCVDYRNFDLRTGRELQLSDLLRPGYEERLEQLLRGKLAVVWENGYYATVGEQGELPTGGFSIRPTGLAFTYDQRDDESLAWPGPYHADRDITVELSYRELLPLIRPAGPLAAMLRERGLTAAPSATPAGKTGK